MIWLEAICALIILLFVYASLSKFFDFAGFQHDMYNQVFSHWLSTIFIYTLPPIELAISFSLIIERFRKVGLIASLILMLLFTLYTASVLLHFFPRVPCSCGGIIKKLTWGQHLILNIIYTLIATAGIWLNRKRVDDQSAIPATIA